MKDKNYSAFHESIEIIDLNGKRVAILRTDSSSLSCRMENFSDYLEEILGIPVMYVHTSVEIKDLDLT